MKIIIGLLLIVCSLSLHAQYSLETYSDEELELLEIIKSDAELYQYYNSGLDKLKSAKVEGYTSLAFMGSSIVFFTLAANNLDVADADQNLKYVSFAIISMAISFLPGTNALLARRKGRKRIRNAFDAARGDLDSEFYGGFDIQVTSNGIGLVYSF